MAQRIPIPTVDVKDVGGDGDYVGSVNIGDFEIVGEGIEEIAGADNNGVFLQGCVKIVRKVGGVVMAASV
ncbi:MAG: hypothetical protein A3A85_00880 [Deltaproteobacteria bacterium RIFCSPLOWO2_01_FULL_42_9]|nr:MAG: hypothetical protein A3A85_00880 [Deltaproteobacteria bacterium RIFCSPLOWO2_01_FULL_42_9]